METRKLNETEKEAIHLANNTLRKLGAAIVEVAGQAMMEDKILHVAAFLKLWKENGELQIHAFCLERDDERVQPSIDMFVSKVAKHAEDYHAILEEAQSFQNQ